MLRSFQSRLSHNRHNVSPLPWCRYALQLSQSVRSCERQLERKQVVDQLRAWVPC